MWDMHESLLQLRRNAITRAQVAFRKAHHQKAGWRCAVAVHDALEGGGLHFSPPEPTVEPPYSSAKDYGPKLVQVGFQWIARSNRPMAGDVIIFNGVDGHPHGHITMFDGWNWISDFVQLSEYSNAAYIHAGERGRLYRHPVGYDQDGSSASAFA